MRKEVELILSGEREDLNKMSEKERLYYKMSLEYFYENKRLISKFEIVNILLNEFIDLKENENKKEDYEYIIGEIEELISFYIKENKKEYN
jgi:hypothetical protein